MKRRKWLQNTYLVLTGICTLLFVVFDIALPNWSRLRAAKNVTRYHPLLDSLAHRALATNDVPIAACLLYQGQIIGLGYNTVSADGAICAHAEINALNDASRHLGVDSFRKMGREELQLISTFEPCLMCRGAAIENGITRVVSILPKKYSDRWKQWKGTWQYGYYSRRSTDPYFQYQLFKLHPQFDSSRYPF